MSYPRKFLAFGLLALVGCDDVVDLDPLDERPPVEARVRPAPITGGTLVLTHDGLAVAADPDRDRVHVVNLSARSVRHTIKLEPGDQPGRVVLGSEGRAHVVLRGYGGLATVDPQEGTVLARHWLCPEPRGVAYHGLDSSLYVACAGGMVYHLSEDGEELERTRLKPDIRDVVIVDDTVMVSRFRSAELLGLNGGGIKIPTQGSLVPHVAWRTWVDHNGNLAMVHQMESTQPVPIDPRPEDLPPGGSPYGGGSFCNPGIVNAAYTSIVDGEVQTTTLLDSHLTVDAAFSHDGAWIALAVPGAPEPTDGDGDESDDGSREFNPDISRSSVRIEPTGVGECFSTVEVPDNGQITAVAFDPTGALVMQSREPARLVILDNVNSGKTHTIELKGESRYDTGHEIFHRATESGLSCASCHPEASDDGHVWTFEGLGKRSTQTIDVGLADTAPFHWDGDMEDIGVLMAEVLAHRMGGMRQSPERGESFTRWMFEQQRPPADDGEGDIDLVLAGEELFATYDCTRCHDGPALGGDRTELIRGSQKQVPTLRRVALHPPYMHDGRSLTLEDAVRDMIESTQSSSAPQEDIDAITAYLRTL